MDHFSMWSDFTKISVGPTDLIIRAVVVFVFVLVLLRLSGKRQVGQMNATELVAIMLISNAVQNSMNGGDNSLLGGLILALVLVVMSVGISVLSYRSRAFRAVVEGTPTLLVHKGKVLPENLKRERISMNELVMLLRKQGVHHFHEVKTAILESDGSLSISRPEDLHQIEVPGFDLPKP